MKLFDYKEWPSLLANLGVILGIIFLATEINQTNELMESERRFNRLQIVVDGNSQWMNNPLLFEALPKARAGEELTESEEFAMEMQFTNIFNSWQWTWIELGETEEFPFAQYKATMQREYVQSQWQLRKLVLNPEFVQFVDENLIPR